MSDLLFLSHSGANLPSVRFRVRPFVELARKRGVDAAWRRYPKTVFQRIGFFALLPRTPVIVLQKKLVSGAELSLLQSRAGKLVFDFDDALWAKHPNQGEAGGRGDERELKRLLRVCAGVDRVVAGNNFLAEKVRGVARRVDVLPTPLDTDAYVPGDGEKTGKPVVGWMGTSGNLFFLPEVFAALQPMAGWFDVSVVSDGEFAIPGGFGGGCTRWTPEDELCRLQAMDIGLMPLSDDEYTRGKCGFKLLQYMACGVVPIASDVGFNRDIITHGKDGFLAAAPGEFAEYVQRLVQDSDLRVEMARRARRTVVERFSLNAAARRLWDILEV